MGGAAVAEEAGLVRVGVEREVLDAAHARVRGFAVGRTICGDVARAWMPGATGDEAAVDGMAVRYSRLCEVWDAARTQAKGN